MPRYDWKIIVAALKFVAPKEKNTGIRILRYINVIKYGILVIRLRGFPWYLCLFQYKSIFYFFRILGTNTVQLDTIFTHRYQYYSFFYLFLEIETQNKEISTILILCCYTTDFYHSKTSPYRFCESFENHDCPIIPFHHASRQQSPILLPFAILRCLPSV